MHAAPLKSFLPSLFTATLLLLVTPTLLAQQMTASMPPDNPAPPSASTANPAHHPPAAPTPQLIVIGFAGGFVHRTNAIHGEVALALHLRDQHGASIQSEIFENHHGRDAHREILRLLAAQHIAPANARIILYGHSWGATEAVATARRLESDGIPVLLLAQVDGVDKPEADINSDASLIPANVAQAINFYQDEGLLHGRTAIHAANPRLTRILGNIHLSYRHHNVACTSYPWFARTFMHQHIEIENDPRVWTQIESLILSQIVPPSQPQKDIATTTVVSKPVAF